MQQAIIVDLDNTLFDSRVLNQYLPEDKNSREGWDEFHKQYWRCKPISYMCQFLYGAKYNYKIIFVTSREETKETRKVTELELKKCNIKDFILLMRPYENYDSSDVVKQMLYEQHIKNKFNVLVAMDDDENVLKMWRKNGINTLKCEFGECIK